MREKRAVWDSRVMQLLPIKQMYGPRSANFSPYLYRTDDYGDTWTRLTTGTNGIPADYLTPLVRHPRRSAALVDERFLKHRVAIGHREPMEPRSVYWK